ncbi:MAG: beta-galactosidase [Acidobacteriota bacterium]
MKTVFGCAGLLMIGACLPGLRLATAQTSPACPRLIEFSGEQADPSDLHLSDVSGRVLIYYWSQLEPKRDKFDFREMDREVSMWTDAGKEVVLRLSTAGWTKWREPWSRMGTPSWAYRKYHIGSVTEMDGAVLPVYWSPGYLDGLAQFLHGVSAHVAASPWRGKVAFIEIAAGDGGETKPDTEENKTPEQRAARLALWQRAGYSNAVWYEAIGHVIDVYQKAFPASPLALMPDSSFLGGACTLPNPPGCRETAILSLADEKGLILQDNGFDRTHVYPAEWHNGRPLVCEQLQSATRQGYALGDDLEQSIRAGCSWLMVFRQDLRRPDFQHQVSDFYRKCAGTPSTAHAGGGA